MYLHRVSRLPKYHNFLKNVNTIFFFYQKRCRIYLYITYKSLVTLIDCMIDRMFEAVRTNPRYGMATIIYNNLLNLILGTIMFLRST